MTIHYASITWNAASYGPALFRRYDLQRTEDGGTTWATIAKITDEAATTFRDYEARRGSSAFYRVRAVREDGFLSDWVTTGAPVVQPSPAQWQIVSNEDPTVNLEVDVLNDAAEAMSYTFGVNEGAYEAEGRDGQLVLRGSERLGDSFTLNVVAAYETDRPGRSAFDTLLALCRRQGLSYVALMEPEGYRWYAALTLATGKQSANRGRYDLPITVREVTFTPSTPDVAA